LHQEAGASRRIVPLYDGTVKRTKDGRYVFTGELTAWDPGDKGWMGPLTWPGAPDPLLGPGQPSLIFVVSMADLFVEDRPKFLIDRTVGTIAVSEHIGLLLTRREDLMAEYFGAPRSPETLHRGKRRLWLGFSAERQAEFDERWRCMRPLAEAGWVTFVSIAPMLEPVTLPPDFLSFGPQVWVIASGEQRVPGVPHDRIRDMHPNWARAVRDQCAAAGVPFFLKQMARREPIPPDLFIREFPAVRLAEGAEEC
jgi:protein gp37